ncbi:hypothetical protein AAHA92_16056 [Salvia divinorum]|uniref:Uncharacterized protein n=1 Tax=Salvia divinorum TaxID=28513 RepID=A0ABD1GUB9_SALDI
MGGGGKSNAKACILVYRRVLQFGKGSRWFEIHLRSSRDGIREYAKRIHRASKRRRLRATCQDTNQNQLHPKEVRIMRELGVHKSLLLQHMKPLP